MVSLINKQLLLTAYAYLFIMEQQKAQQGSEALQMQGGEKTFAEYTQELYRNREQNRPAQQQQHTVNEEVKQGFQNPAQSLYPQSRQSPHAPQQSTYPAQQLQMVNEAVENNDFLATEQEVVDTERQVLKAWEEDYREESTPPGLEVVAEQERQQSMLRKRGRDGVLLPSQRSQGFESVTQIPSVVPAAGSWGDEEKELFLVKVRAASGTPRGARDVNWTSNLHDVTVDAIRTLRKEIRESAKADDGINETKLAHGRPRQAGVLGQTFRTLVEAGVFVEADKPPSKNGGRPGGVLYKLSDWMDDGTKHTSSEEKTAPPLTELDTEEKKTKFLAEVAAVLSSGDKKRPDGWWGDQVHVTVAGIRLFGQGMSLTASQLAQGMTKSRDGVSETFNHLVEEAVFEGAGLIGGGCKPGTQAYGVSAWMRDGLLKAGLHSLRSGKREESVTTLS